MLWPIPVRLARSQWGPVFLLLFLPLFIAACDSGGSVDDTNDDELNCTFPVDFLNEGSNRGEITPVNDPELVGAEEAEDRLSAFSDTDRILGFPPSFHESYEDTPLAVPLDVLFESEVMNLDGWANRPLAITFCPLTTSTLVFDRAAIDGGRFEISGLLLNKGNEDHPGNLVMVNEDGESLWPQMSMGAVCGSKRGTSLTKLPAIEMTWGRWTELYPSTDVALGGDASSRAAEAGSGRATASPSFDSGAEKSAEGVPLGRVLGIPGRGRVGGGSGGVAVPFEDLDDGTPVRVVEVSGRSETFTVFWNREARSAMAFRTTSSFSVQDGQIVDDGTQSVWSVDGRAVDGPREGERLDPIDTAYIASGRAWFDFQPDTDLWDGSS